MLYILSIQGKERVTENGGNFNNQENTTSVIKVVDTKTSKKSDWKLGVFTQPSSEIHTEEELEKLKKLGFEIWEYDPYRENDENVSKLLNKFGMIQDEEYDEDLDKYVGHTFCGNIIVGEISLEKAKELSKQYSKNNCVY